MRPLAVCSTANPPNVIVLTSAGDGRLDACTTTNGAAHWAAPLGTTVVCQPGGLPGAGGGAATAVRGRRSRAGAHDRAVAVAADRELVAAGRQRLDEVAVARAVRRACRRLRRGAGVQQAGVRVGAGR